MRELRSIPQPDTHRARVQAAAAWRLFIQTGHGYWLIVHDIFKQLARGY